MGLMWSMDSVQPTYWPRRLASSTTLLPSPFRFGMADTRALMMLRSVISRLGLAGFSRRHWAWNRKASGGRRPYSS